MQQNCYDMYGMNVEKSILARMNSEMEEEEEPMELIHHGLTSQRVSSPPLLDHHHHQACSGDEDGNSSENQNRSPSTSCENSIIEEPKAKKRRKQSNPSRYQTTPVLPLIDSEECSGVASTTMVEDSKTNEVLDLHTERESQSQERDHRYRCHHCNSLFDTEDLLRIHVEEEHVQKILERQLQQQSYNKSTTSGNSNMSSREGSSEPSKDSNCSSNSLNNHNNNNNNNSNIVKPINDSMALAVVTSDQIRCSPPDNMQLQENREFKNPHFPFPPMPPPFIPFTRNDDLKQGNLSVPLSMFPNPMAPFLFPVIPQGQTPPATNGSSHSAHGVRIFNLEAYCELCNKEFCNKYFLKTHKANKHGIYSADTMNAPPYGQPFLSAGLSSPIPLPHLLQPPTSEPLPPSRTGLINMESYCEICQKEFCNKYFLKKHKQKIHGIVEPGQNISPSSTPSIDAKSNSPVVATAAISLTTAPTGPSEKGGMYLEEGHDVPVSKMEFPSLFNLQNHKLPPTSSSVSTTSAALPPTSCPPITTISMTGEIPSPISHHNSSNDGMIPHVFTPEKLREMGVINADAFCELCCKEFCNKYFLRTHKQNKHGINMPEISPGKSIGGNGGSNSQPSLQTSQSQGSSSNDKHEMVLNDNQLSPDKIMQVSSPGMLNFDGISGDLSCEFCNRPFSSLYLLKMHKFYSHNIPYVKEESKSKPNSPTGGNNGNENKENEFVRPLLPLPPPTLLTENVSISLQEDVASQDLQKLQSMIRELNASAGSESSKISCNLCRLEFDNKYFLRAHMMNEHGVLPNEDGHAPSHNNHSDFGLHSKGSENVTDFPKLTFTSSSCTADSEAYCEICQKEFCSKYFLKTHKQNIHGIPLDMSSSQKKPNLLEEVSQIKTIVNNTLSTSLPPLSIANSSSGNLPVSSSSSSPVAVTATITTSAPVSQNPITTVPHHSVASSHLSLFVPHPSSCSTYTSHMVPFPSDILPNASNVTPTITHTSSVIFPSNLHSSVNVPPQVSISHTSSSLHVPATALVSNIAHLQSTAHLSNIHPPSNHPLSPLDKPRNLTGRNYCNICNKELCNKYFMKTHMLKMHGINLDSQPHEAARISTIGGVQCDICQKELCSKYFLKVHKQNTHGIFEEASQVKDPTRDPTEKDQSQQLQGLDLSDPSGRYFSHYPEICPICNCRFKSIKWLKAHMASDHGNVLKDSLSHNALLESNTNIDSSCICVLCGQGFGDKVALHVHLIKDHQPTTEELGAASNSGIKTPSSSADSSALIVPEQARVNGNSSPASAALPANHPKHHHHHPHHHLHHHHHAKAHGVGGSRIYHCSFCVYSTRWLSNLYAHEKRHTGVNTEGEKKFVCRVCHRAYRYNHSLQRHFLSHRAAGLNMKELSQPLIVSSSNSHHSHHQHLAQNLSRPWSSNHGKIDDKFSSSQQSSHKIKRYRCSKCSKKFRTREMCLSHIHTIHGSGKKGVGSVLQKSVKPFRCRFCGFATRAWNVLKIHINKQHHNDLEPPRLVLEEGEKVTQSSLPSQESPVASAGGGGAMPGLPPPPPNSPHLPMTFAMPHNPPNAGSFIMQPFLLAQPENDGGASSRNGTFVPSLVYLPVCQKVSQPMTVAFSLTPA